MDYLNLVIPALVLILIGWKWKLPSVFLLILWILSIAMNSLLFSIAHLDGLHQALPIRILIIGSVTILLLLASLLFLFFRNPERIPPADPNAILCPADGIVRYALSFGSDGAVEIEKQGRKIEIDEIIKGALNIRDGVHIGIEMRVIDVHVNRSPIDGVIIRQKHFPGSFRSLRDLRALPENERVVTLIDNKQYRIVLVQIASRLVRRIVSYFEEGAAVQRGQRIGMIRFGSQVDLILPRIKGLELLIQKGQKVKAGETIIATYPDFIDGAEK
jgi:phosphatidylserine decarboxylase